LLFTLKRKKRHYEKKRNDPNGKHVIMELRAEGLTGYESKEKKK